LKTSFIAVVLAAFAFSGPAFATELELGFTLQGKPDHAKGKGGNKKKVEEEPIEEEPVEEDPIASDPIAVPSLRFWMQDDVDDAWGSGFMGQGVTITVIDDFTSGNRYSGDLGDGQESLHHGEWTYKQASLIAPSANMVADDFSSADTVPLGSGLNVMNLSYGMMAPDGYSLRQINWSAQEQSLIDYAWNGDAILSKAAGNDGVAVGTATADGSKDYLASALIGAQSALFVGALDANGSTSAPASLAWYSNFAGDDPTVQAQFLTIGVEGSETGLYGTSFAAPIASGYAAILGSKFTSATPTEIANQLLDTARTDTIKGYDISIHGQGEASISRALAPVSIN
jgi:subtilisin family serine protease